MTQMLPDIPAVGQVVSVELGVAVAVGIIAVGALTAWILSVLAIRVAIRGLRAELRSQERIRQRLERSEWFKQSEGGPGSPNSSASAGESVAVRGEVSGPHGQSRFVRKAPTTSTAEQSQQAEQPERSKLSDQSEQSGRPAHPSRLGEGRKRVGVGRVKKTEFKFDVADEFEMPFGPTPPEAPEKPQAEKAAEKAAG